MCYCVRMGIESITNRLKSERRDVTVQTSISAADADRLDRLAAWMGEHGVETNRSGVIRALVLDSLDAFDEVQAEQAPAPRPIRDVPQA